MLEIAEVSWSNFLSYGNYVTTIDFTKLSQCLVVGEVLDNNSDESNDSTIVIDSHLGRKRKSNGAGKSTIPSVIQWALFGRTMHSASPGDSVVNWFTGKDCWAKITFKNGDTILRTRNTAGSNELLFTRNGDEHKLTSDTVSTSKNQQIVLDKEFGLDWDLFCGSAFFSQYGKPWMEMSDTSRKKAFERLLHADRLSYYSKSSKNKCDIVDAQVAKLNSQKQSLSAEIARLKNDISDLENSILSYKDTLIAKRDKIAALATEELCKRDDIIIPNEEKLISKWRIIDQIKEKISIFEDKADSLNDKIYKLNKDIDRLESKLESVNSKINIWKSRDGKMCTSCEQKITSTHINDRIEPYIENQSDLTEQISDLVIQRGQLKTQLSTQLSKIEESNLILRNNTPKFTLRDIEALKTKRAIHDKEYNRLIKMAESILEEECPYIGMLSRTQMRLADCEKLITKVDTDIQRYTHLSKHLIYINKVYTDRTKIKSLAFQDHVPFINNRLRHYLDVFGLDVKIKLTDSLSIESSMWKYEYESGGERKKTDLAMMFAIFDFHEYMYGRQCNILVLDEVDGRLDEDAVDSLISIIKSDLAHRVETVLVISHKNTMKDVFPNELCVQRVKRFSYIKPV